MPYRHVLVICDGPGCEDAVRAASQLANRDRAQLTVAAVAEIERPAGCQMQTAIWNDVLRDAAADDLERARRVVESPAHFEVLSGDFSAAVASAVRELGCDAIMISARPATALRRLISRDRAKSLRRRTDCPVLRPS